MDIPLPGQPIAEYPVEVPCVVSGDVVVPAGGLLPPVVLTSLRPVKQVKGAIPVQPAVVLSQALRLGNQPEGALAAGCFVLLVIEGDITPGMQGELRQVFIPAAHLLHGL